MGKYKTLADIPYEVLVDRALTIACQKYLVATTRMYAEDSELQKMRLLMLNDAANELTGANQNGETGA